MKPEAAVLTVVSQVPITLVDTVLTPVNDAFEIAGQMATLVVDQVTAPAGAGLVITGQAPIVTVAWLPTDDNAFLWVNTYGTGAVSETGNLVTSLNDLSGNARTMLAEDDPITNAETVNGHNVVNTDGSQHFTLAENTLGSTHIVAMAVRVDTVGNQAFDSLFSMDGSSDYQIDNGGNDPEYIPRITSGLSLTAPTASTDIAGAFNLVLFVLDEVTGMGVLWINGMVEAQGSGYDGIFDADNIFILSNRNENRMVDATLGEFVIFSGTADSSLRQRIEGYLAHTWGIQGLLPGAHPYLAEPPTI